MRPRISIVMPVLNCAETLPTAIGSILAQTIETWELLVIDDGSTDSTVERALAIRDARVRVIAEDGKNLGLASRLNLGVQLARGEFIARMDGDDVSFPQRFERQLQFLEEHPEIDLVGCSMVLFDSEGNVIGEQKARRSHEEICGSPLRSCLLPHATWMGRARWFREHPYRPDLRRAEDRELLLRTKSESRFAGIDEVMYGYRVDHVSMRKNAIARGEYLAALWHHTRAHGAVLGGSVAMGAEICKLLIDSLALLSGGEKSLLRRRSRPLRDDALEVEWIAVWRTLQKPCEELA